MNHKGEKENVFEEVLMAAQRKTIEEGGDPVYRGGDSWGGFIGGGGNCLPKGGNDLYSTK